MQSKKASTRVGSIPEVVSSVLEEVLDDSIESFFVGPATLKAAARVNRMWSHHALSRLWRTTTLRSLIQVAFPLTMEYDSEDIGLVSLHRLHTPSVLR